MNRQMTRRPGMRCFLHKMVARNVVARIKSIEISLHQFEFFSAVSGQRFDGLIGGAALLLGGQLLGPGGTLRNRRGPPRHFRLETADIVGKTGVKKADSHRFCRR